MAKGKSSSAAVDKISLVINERTADWTLGAMVQISAAAALSCGFGSKNCGEGDEIVGTDTVKQPTSGSGVADMPWLLWP